MTLGILGYSGPWLLPSQGEVLVAVIGILLPLQGGDSSFWGTRVPMELIMKIVSRSPGSFHACVPDAAGQSCAEGNAPGT